MKRLWVVPFVLLAFLGIVTVLLAVGNALPAVTTVIIAVPKLPTETADQDILKAELMKVKGVVDIPEMNATSGMMAAKIDENALPVGAFMNAVAANATIKAKNTAEDIRWFIWFDTRNTINAKALSDAQIAEATRVMKGIKGVASVQFNETGKAAAVTFADKATTTSIQFGRPLGHNKNRYLLCYTGPVAETQYPKLDGCNSCHTGK